MAFTPIDLGNLVAWYRADAGLTLDVASVTQWADQSGQGHHLTSEAGRYPSWVEAQTVSGLPHVLFNGAPTNGQYLWTQAFTLNQPFNVYLLGRQVSYTQGRRIYSGLTDGYLYQSNTVPPNVTMRTGASAGNTVTTWAVGGHAVVFNAWNDTASKHWMNRRRVGGGTPGTGNFGGLVLGASNLKALAGNVALVEMVVTSGSESAVDQSRVHHYLAGRGGLAFHSLVAEGDSLTAGAGLAAVDLFADKVQVALSVTHNWGYVIQAVGGNTIAQMAARSSDTDAMLDAGNCRNVLTVWCGVNSILGGDSASSVFAQLWDYCVARRNAGWTVLLLSLTPAIRGDTPDYNTRRNGVNDLVRAQWPGCADGLVDVGGDATLGPDGAPANVTYYSDGTHLTAAGHTIVAGLVQSALGVLAGESVPIRSVRCALLPETRLRVSVSS